MLWAIVGLPGSGKSTLFQLLTHKAAGRKSGKGLDLAVMKVPDDRLGRLAEIFQPERVGHAEIEFADTVGDIKKGGEILGGLQRADGLIICLRAFDAGFGQPNPYGDFVQLTSELALFDLGILERKEESIDQLFRTAKPHERQKLEREKEFVDDLKSHLEEDTPVRKIDITPEQEEMVDNFGLLTAKPALIVLNCDEPRYNVTDKIIDRIKKSDDSLGITKMMAQMEIELEELEPEEAEAFRRELGLGEPAAEVVTKNAYDVANTITFFTGSDVEVHAWTIPAGTDAIDAAGKIHSDMARGFIRAEVIGFEDLSRAGSWARARSGGILRQEGKEYIVQDGDVILVRFAV